MKSCVMHGNLWHILSVSACVKISRLNPINWVESPRVVDFYGLGRWVFHGVPAVGFFKTRASFSCEFLPCCM